MSHKLYDVSVSLFPAINLDVIGNLFLQSYTQYIPLPIRDLDSWLKTPSIYVFDCSAAGMVVNAFIEVCTTRVSLD